MLKIKCWILTLSIIFFSKICFGIYLPNITGCHIPVSDYGILTDQEKIPHKNIRWQCFPVAEVTLSLVDWVTDKDHYVKSTIHSGNLTITGFTNGKNLREECQGRNEYYLSDKLSIGEAEKVFHQLQKTMKDRKYVCILGRHTSKELIFNGTQPLDNWIFEKMRTKNVFILVGFK
jgi:hypothetical protein